MYITLVIVGLIAGLLSGSVGFGGGMILLPVITYFYGVDVAVPVSTIAQLLSNLSRVGMGLRQINWKAVGQFLLLAAPFTALGAFGFAKVPKGPMTVVLCVFLIIFAIMKLRGKMRLPHKPATMIVGGGVTGLINGLLGISGPLSSAVFLTLDLAPVSYIASEATAAAAMHIIKSIVYGKNEPYVRQYFPQRTDDRMRYDAGQLHRNALHQERQSRTLPEDSRRRDDCRLTLADCLPVYRETAINCTIGTNRAITMCSPKSVNDNNLFDKDFLRSNIMSDGCFSNTSCIM